MNVFPPLFIPSSTLVNYVEQCILPRYSAFDAGHDEQHVRSVIASSMLFAQGYDVSPDMVYAIAAYHDLGLVAGRERHHLESAIILLSDERLLEWFTEGQLRVMAQAVEDHRASAGHEPRSIYGRIVADADHDDTPDDVIRRTLQYGLDHYPEMDEDAQVERAIDHLKDKYGPQGYLHFWLDEARCSPNRTATLELFDDLPALIEKVRTMLRTMRL